MKQTTMVIVEHESIEALQASPLWAEIMAVFLADDTSAVRVVEITADTAGDWP